MIESNEPITYPASVARTFAQMKITDFSIERHRGKMQVTASLRNFDAATEEFDPRRHTFVVQISDLVAASETTKRIDNVMKELDVVVGLVYNVQFIEQKIYEAKAVGGDTAQLEIDLQEARDVLNADPDIELR